MNEQLEIDGQKFTVHEQTLSPIRAELTLPIEWHIGMSISSGNESSKHCIISVNPHAQKNASI